MMRGNGTRRPSLAPEKVGYSCHELGVRVFVPEAGAPSVEVVPRRPGTCSDAGILVGGERERPSTLRNGSNPCSGAHQDLVNSSLIIRGIEPGLMGDDPSDDLGVPRGAIQATGHRVKKKKSHYEGRHAPRLPGRRPYFAERTRSRYTSQGQPGPGSQWPAPAENASVPCL